MICVVLDGSNVRRIRVTAYLAFLRMRTTIFRKRYHTSLDGIAMFFDIGTLDGRLEMNIPVIIVHNDCSHYV